MKFFALFFLVVLTFFQYKLWIDENGWRGHQKLEEQLKQQRIKNREQTAMNKALRVDVDNLAKSHEAFEEIAREQFSYVKQGEILYITRD